VVPLAALFGLAVACGGEDVVLVTPTRGDPADLAAPGAIPTAPADTEPAILVSSHVRTPEGGNIYVGALPNIPEGQLDRSRFLELSEDVDVFTHAGYVFVWDREPAIMTRFSVRDDMTLVEGPRLSLASALPGVGRHVVISETRAYTLSTSLETLAIWNPTSMEVTAIVPLDPPDVDPTFSPSVGMGTLAGNQVIWPIEWFGDQTIRRSSMVVIANIASDGPPSFTEDTRCSGATSHHRDAAGDFYVYALAGDGFFAGYDLSGGEVRTCILRVKANEPGFDPSYVVDLRELTGTYINRAWFHVRDSQYLAYVWDTSVPLPDSGWEGYNQTPLRPFLIDLAEEAVVAYPHVVGNAVVASMQFNVDGVAYHQVSDNAQGNEIAAGTEILEVHPDGALPRFSISPGTLNALSRIR
jgi:hypothetical protein